MIRWKCAVIVPLLMCGWVSATEQTVRNTVELRAALRAARPGDRILLAPGDYDGGLHIAGLSGTRDARIVIQGTDTARPPVFSGGGGQAIHLADCNFVTLANLVARGFTANGINIDDGGTFDSPSVGIIVENVTILETGPRGNRDALKMSGVDQFVVRNCRFEGWGGSAIDMVGCHDGLITGCVFVGREDFEQSNAVQIKGGSRNVVVERSLFRDAGQRAINCGGSTGLAFFRPRVGDYEAKDVTVAGNRFVGGVAAMAWVTSDGGHFHHNTIILPEKWIGRILQETRDEQFRPCHGGIFEDNVIVYDRRIATFFNVGPGTAPDTFTFRRNVWCPVNDAPRPTLPVPEHAGIHDVALTRDQIDLDTGDLNTDDPRVTSKGAAAYRGLR
jgi:hypothetical protein